IERLRLGRGRIGPIETVRGKRDRRQQSQHYDADEFLHGSPPGFRARTGWRDQPRLSAPPARNKAPSGAQAAVRPPSITRVCPVTDAAPGLASQRTAAATSAGVTNWCSGMRLSIASM